MALIKFGGGIVQMAGSIAGDVFARNRYGNYSRARTKPTNPNTAGQQSVRAALTALTARWSQTLTAAQRTAWNLYASNVAMLNRLGESIYLSGYNHFIRSNLTRQRVAALSLVDDGPTIFELPGKDPTLSISASEATQQISTTFDNTQAWANESGGYLFLYQGQPQNSQRNFFGGPWRRLKVVIGDPTPPSSPDVTDVVFAIAEGQHQWLYARISRADGRLSEPFRDDCFCAS